MAPTVIEWLCVPGARRTSSCSSGCVYVAEFQQADAGHDAERVLEERQAAAHEEAGHHAPAARQKPSLRIRAIGWCSQSPVAQVRIR